MLIAAKLLIKKVNRSDVEFQMMSEKYTSIMYDRNNEIGRQNYR